MFGLDKFFIVLIAFILFCHNGMYRTNMSAHPNYSWYLWKSCIKIKTLMEWMVSADKLIYSRWDHWRPRGIENTYQLTCEVPTCAQLSSAVSLKDDFLHFFWTLNALCSHNIFDHAPNNQLQSLVNLRPMCCSLTMPSELAQTLPTGQLRCLGWQKINLISSVKTTQML